MLLPKVELHVHLEGTAPPALIKQLASRNGVTLNPAIFANEQCFAWKDFLDFLDVYERASHVIKVPQDYYDITYQYLKQCALEGTIYCEMMYSPEHAERASSMPSHESLVAIQHAIDDAERDFAIIGRILISCVRHYGVDSTIKVAEYAVKENLPCIVGFAMGGDEINFPAQLFTTAYAIARAGGLPCTAHAGEMAGPDSILTAITQLGVTRVGHGIRAIEDPKVLDLIRQRDVVLEVCPGSNLALGLYKSYQEHPFNLLRAASIQVTLNSDDPPYFATTIGKEYNAAQQHFGLTAAQLLDVTRTAIKAAFVDKQTKQQLLQRVLDYQLAN